MAILAIAVLFEALKRSPAPEEEEQENELDEVPTTADEALPTQTGRFRALQALASTEKKEELPNGTSQEVKKSVVLGVVEDEGDSPLPDPFKKK